MNSIPCDTCILFPMCIEQAKNSNTLICSLLNKWMDKENNPWSKSFKELNGLFRPTRIEIVLKEEGR